MTIGKVFFGYMALVGAAVGAIIVSMPQVMELRLKPYFWVVIAVALFDGAAYLLGRRTPATMLSMDARLIGFVIGIVVMVVIPMITGSPARFF